MVRLRPRSKNPEKALNPEETPEKQPLIIHYDANGVRIGDDGYSMTPIRTRMHRLCNAAFIWGMVCLVAAIACTVAAYAQGQDFVGDVSASGSFEINVVGGNTFNGYSMGSLLRYEAIFALFNAIFFSVLHIQAFKWFYDRVPVTFTAVLLVLLGVAAAVYLVLIIMLVAIPEPISIVSLIIVGLTAFTMKQVADERPSLKKAKIAKTVEKK